MDFSKKGTKDKEKQIRSAKKKLAVKAGVSFFRTFLVCLVMITIIGGFAGFGALKGIIDNAPDIKPEDIIPSDFFSTVYDSKGNEIQRLVASNANREYASIDEIPKIMQNAFIAIEDERFWTHNGIDVKGIFRAFFNGLSKGDFDQGASTITQQLLKNQIFEGGMESSFAERLERKIQEQYLAIQLENQLSKEQILEYYLNTINLGQNTLGVKSAAHRYFNKEVSDLTLSESAVIAGITKSPSYLNPITFPNKNAERRLDILNNMKTQGYITDAAYNEALRDDVYERIALVNDEQFSSGIVVNSYFTDEVIDQITSDLQTKLGYSSTQAYNMIYRSGLQIFTTQNTSIQKTCDRIFADEDLYPANSKYELTYRLTTVDADGNKTNYNELMLKEYFLKKNASFSLYFKKKKDADPYIEEYRASVVGRNDAIEGELITFTIQPQISFVLMEQSTGKVLAIVGGRGKKTASRTLNRATNTPRQPGSTFKILSAYLPALDTKGLTLASVKDDAPYAYSDGTPINNWNGNKYNGLTTLRQAIYNSMNIMAVKTLEEVTPQAAYSNLQKLGFTTLEDNYVDDSTGKVFSDINLSMALGGLTKGVTNLELTAAFSAIANSGIYTKPIFYTKIVDHNGKVLIDNVPETSQVMRDSTAWLLTSAMEDVVTKGTGTKVKFQSLDMPLAGKTGTTSDDYDLWFVGYTPYYTAGLWGGYDHNLDQEDTSYVKVLWRTVMEKLHAKKKRKDFKRPDSIESATVCNKCGKLAIDGVCNITPGGSSSIKEFFAKGTSPTETCDCHIKVAICKASSRSPNKFCPADSIGSRVFLIKKETDATADTPYILPKNFEGKTCNIHAKAIETPIPEEEVPDEDRPEEDLPPDTPPEELPPELPEPSFHPLPSEPEIPILP